MGILGTLGYVHELLRLVAEILRLDIDVDQIDRRLPLVIFLFPLLGSQFMRLVERRLGRGQLVGLDGHSREVVIGVGILQIPGTGGNAVVLVEILQSVTVDLPRLRDGKRRPLLPQTLDGPGIVVLVVVEEPRHTVQLEDVRLHICDNDIRLPVLKEELDVIRLVTLK